VKGLFGWIRFLICFAPFSVERSYLLLEIRFSVQALKTHLRPKVRIRFSSAAIIVGAPHRVSVLDSKERNQEPYIETYRQQASTGTRSEEILTEWI